MHIIGIIGEWFRRIEYLLNRGRREAELAREIDAHRAMMIDPRRFGNALLVRERSGDVWGWSWLDDVARDVRFAARTLLRAPGFTIVVVTSLALATGATTAIFSIVNSVLLRPLPFAEPDRLMQVAMIHRVGGAGSVPYADLQAFREQSVSFERFSGYEVTTRLLETANGSERLTGVVADREFFALLGVRPIAGRVFTKDDPPSVVVVSARLWERLFDRNPSLVGRTIALSGTRWNAAERRSVLQRREVTVIGIMPESFQFPYGVSATFPGALPEMRTDIWVPDDRIAGGRFGSVTGRLKAGVTVQAAAAELDILRKRVDVTSPSPYRPTGVELTPLTTDVLGAIHRSLWLLFGAVGLVLAAACANVANLLLARTTARTQEVVTRAALGAGPGRLVRQFLAESLLMSLAGGLLGVAVAAWGVNLLATVGAAKIPRLHEVVLDWRAFVFMLTVCVLAAVLFGLAPALIASRADAQSITKESGGRATVSSRYNRARDALVIAEVALAFLLAFGVAGVMRELSRLERTDPGMVTDGVLSLHITPRLFDRDYYAIEARVKQIPGVEAAGFTQMVPLQNWNWLGDIHITGRPREQRLTVELRTVTPGYFDALGIPIRGRVIAERDAVGEGRGILVNEAFARQHLPDDDPLGRRTDRGTIVGVVGDVRQSRLDRPAIPEIYGSIGPDAGVASELGMSLIVRSKTSLEALVPALRAAVRETSPVAAIFNVKTMEQVVADSLWELNLYRWAIGLFAGLALLLAAIGLYGVISYSVSSRTREFAVRLALGAEPSGIARLVLNRGIRLAAIGLALGVLSALGVLPFLRNLATAIRPDFGTFLIISGLLLAISLAACLVPALRVAGVNPATALRRD
jgi:putative ABC transport system permease protein